MKSLKALKNDVFDKGLCSSCGACVGLCPYIRDREDRVAIIHTCREDEGRCYKLCPKIDNDGISIREGEILGKYRAIFMTQACDKAISSRAQYGGTVSGLLTCELKRGGAKRIIGVSRNMAKPILAVPYIIRKAEDVILCAGSKYTACASLKLINLREDQDGILGFVGRPCQIKGLRNMAREDASIRVGTVVGLFCMWALSYRNLVDYLQQKVKVSGIDRLDIGGKDLIIKMRKGNLRMPVDDIRQFRLPACDACIDPIAELADISVGATEWKQSWNTLIVRTKRGEALVEMALKKGFIKAREMPKDRIEILKQAVSVKKKRALERYNELRNA